MPPKGKKGKKKGSKKAARASALVDSIKEQSKEFYLLEIKELETRLARYENKCNQLLAKNSNFESELERTVQDQKDAINIYNKTFEQKIHELADMRDRLVGLQQAGDVERDWYERRLQQLGNEYKETKDQLISENTLIGMQLAQLDDFKARKAELNAQLSSLEELVNKQKNSNQESLEQLEQKDLMAKDRMKGQMLTRLNNVAAAFRKVSHQEMADTTKRTIQENVVVTSQLGKMAERSVEIDQENVNLKDHTVAGRRQIREMEAREKELTRNYVSSRKIIGMLTEQAELEKEALMKCELADESFKEQQIEADVLREKLKTTREEVVDVSKKGNVLKLELESTKKRLRSEQDAVDLLTRVITEAAAKLKSSLMKSPSENDEDKSRTASSMSKNILDELYGLLIDRNVEFCEIRKPGKPVKMLRTSSGNRRILPPINITGSIVSLSKAGVREAVVPPDDELLVTKDASTQTGSANSRRNKISISGPELLIGKLTLSECEQVLMSHCIDS